MKRVMILFMVALIPVYGEWDNPKFRLREEMVADGEVIGSVGPISEGYGQFSPHAVDYDDDGDLDLLIGTYSPTKLYYFENVGSATSPELVNHGPLKADGVDITVPSA